MSPEDNPADEVQPTKEEWEAFELRAATDRVRRANAGESCQTIYGHGGARGFAALADDHRLLADAYLADHPADDGEPVTEEWLRAVGFVDDGVHLRLFGWGPCRNGTIQAYWPGTREQEWFVNGTNVQVMATRDHVRRLCAALGVPLRAGEE